MAGAPSERRRYLDIALCQIAPSYCRALSEYQKVLAQRNALLAGCAMRAAIPASSRSGTARWQSTAACCSPPRPGGLRPRRLAAERHRDLTGGAERLRLTYLPSPIRPAPPPLGRRPQVTAAPMTACRASRSPGGCRVCCWRTRSRDIAAGSSLIGPHRDDLAFCGRGARPAAFGSRGQQRTAALALKLAEVQMMREETGDTPLLLLDDVMSELDAARRQAMLAALAEVDQALVTTTDWGDFTPELLAHARQWRVMQGTLGTA